MRTYRHTRVEHFCAFAPGKVFIGIWQTGMQQLADPCFVQTCVCSVFRNNEESSRDLSLGQYGQRMIVAAPQPIIERNAKKAPINCLIALQKLDGLIQ